MGSALTLPPVQADPFHGRCTVPAHLDLTAVRAFLELSDIEPEGAARISVNGRDAGGFLGAPFRLEITPLLRNGENSIDIAPFAPQGVRIVFHER